MALGSSRPLVWLCVALALLALPACRPGLQAELEPGMTRSQVERLLGEPDAVQWAALPEQGLFGPQESLYGPLEPGDPYEEWLYDLGDEERYVWFSGSSEDPASWTVIMTVIAPKGVVY